MVGIVGVVFYQVAYGGLQLGKFHHKDPVYIALNIIAPSCLLFSLIFAFNLAAFITQVLWLSLTIVGFVKLYFDKRNMIKAD